MPVKYAAHHVMTPRPPLAYANHVPCDSHPSVEVPMIICAMLVRSRTNMLTLHTCVCMHSHIPAPCYLTLCTKTSFANAILRRSQRRFAYAYVTFELDRSWKAIANVRVVICLHIFRMLWHILGRHTTWLASRPPEWSAKRQVEDKKCDEEEPRRHDM